MKNIVAFMFGLFILGPMLALSQTFPVGTLLDNAKADVAAWAVALLAIVLAVYGYRKVKAIISRS